VSIRTIATLAIAVVLGLIAVLILNSYLGASRRAQPGLAAVGGTPVVVASLPITRGMTLQPILLKVVNYPQGSVPASGYASVAQLMSGPGQRVALRDLVPDEPVLAPDVSQPGGRSTLSAALDPGTQAVALRASDVTAVGGFVLPGDQVDVLLTRSVSQGNDAQNSVAQIVAENVKVLAVDQSDNDQDNKPTVAKAITVEVTPTQAQAIALGEVVGTISLSLRRPADTEVVSQRATTVADLGFAAPAVRASQPAAPSGVADAAKTDAVPLYGPGIVRVTRVTDTVGYRLSGR
jgi:pilus assembly protein CpaB